MKTECIARASHEIVRAYYATIGFVVPVWEDVPEWHAAGIVNAVLAVTLEPNQSSEEHHAEWLQQRMADGWVLSDSENVDAKEHPYLVPYKDLPEHKKIEDAIFVACVRQMLDLSWALGDSE